MELQKVVTVNLKYTMDDISYYNELKKVDDKLAHDVAIHYLNTIEAECKRLLEEKDKHS